MSKVLVVLTREFPYGKSETFLESELKYISGFQKIYLCPLFAMNSTNSEARCDTKNNYISVLPSRKPLSSLEKVLGLILSMLTSDFWKEVFKVLKQSDRRFCSLRELCSFSYTGAIIERYTQKVLEKALCEEDELVIYAYWLHQQAYTASFLVDHLLHVNKAVSRCHGFDIYEYRSHGYIPYRDRLLSKLDAIYCISENGVDYLKQHYPGYKEKYQLARLGTESLPMPGIKVKNDRFRIVSCSSCVAIKRIDLIIEALALFEKDKVAIEWTHFGDGILLESLTKEARNKIGKYVRYSFKGHLPNHELLEKYSKGSFDLFLNVSATEGIPVSVMEAMSFGIPIIATDVGGTNELVKDEVNGLLLRADFSVEELYEAINKIRTLSDDDYQHLSAQARFTWEDRYSAKNNYSYFSQKLFE